MKRRVHGKRANAIEPALQIGKSGIESVIDELSTQLKNRKLVKVKFLRSAFFEGDRNELAEKLANLTGSELIEVRGNTAVLRRKG